MAKIHIPVQGKGGVGKSFIAAALAQYFVDKGRTLDCVDTDPVNATFAGYKALNVRHLDIMHAEEIDQRRFDELVEIIASAKGDIVIDTGSNAFIPLSYYLLSNGVPALLSEMGHELILHTVVTGGQAMVDTLSNFSLVAKQFADATIVVWLNPYWGRVESGGKEFQQMKVYAEHKDRIAAIVSIPDLKKETHGADLADMLKQRVTFAEAVGDGDRPIMVRQRLKMVQRALYAEMDKVPVL